MATTVQRHHIAGLLTFLHSHAGQLRYPPGDVRTQADATAWHLTETQAEHLLEHGGYMQMDCSEFCSWVLKCVGCWPWGSPGYTGSHLASIRPVYTNPRDADVGALVVFGPGTGHHEAIVEVPDHLHGNPVLASHGRPGFDRVTLDALAASQAAEGHPGVRLLSIQHL